MPAPNGLFFDLCANWSGPEVSQRGFAFETGRMVVGRSSLPQRFPLSRRSGAAPGQGFPAFVQVDQTGTRRLDLFYDSLLAGVVEVGHSGIVHSTRLIDRRDDNAARSSWTHSPYFLGLQSGFCSAHPWM